MSKNDYLLSSSRYRASKIIVSLAHKIKITQIREAHLKTSGLSLDPWSSIFFSRVLTVA